MANWTRQGNVWLPIESLAEAYAGPVVFADKSQTITWFSATADRSKVEHSEHKRDEAGDFMFEDGEPVLDKRPIAPVFWSPAVLS